MKLAIIHLSDIHFNENNNPIAKKADKLFDSLKNTTLEADNTIVIVSGDIANKGKKEEYAQAKIFFDSLFTKLKDYSKKDVNYVFVAGNHDCLFDEEKEDIRELAIEKFIQGGFDDVKESLINTCCEPLQNYFEFESNYLNKDSLIFEHKLLKINVYDLKGFKLKIICYNTSWFSKLKEIPGQMGFPFKLFKDEFEIGKNDLVISVLHHPSNWREPNHARDFKQHLENNSDMVFSGHEHSATKGVYSTTEGNNTWLIEAPALQEDNSPQKSGYNIIELNTDERKIRVQTFQLDSGIYKAKPNQNWVDFLRGSDLRKRNINVNDSFNKYLTNPGAAFAPNNVDSEQIKLNDIFVNPNLKDINPKNIDKKSLDVLSSGNIFKINPLQSLRALILGDENSGKTALCKYHFKNYFDSGLVPILIRAQDIKGITEDKITKCIKESFCEQYHESEYNHFTQLDKKDVIIFIDDIHLLQIKGEFKAILLENILKRYDNIILTGNRLTLFGEFASKSNLYEEFSTYQILECGPELRYEIINRWNYLGSDFLIGKNELLKKNDKAVTFVNNIVRKNLIPAYPFFVLSMLQALESAEEKPQFSMHGYYYQLLISKSLSKAVKGAKDIGFFNKFFTNYCYFLFDEKLRFRGVALSSFEKIYVDHCDKFDVTTVSFERVKKVLVDAKLIHIENDIVKIQYKYVYYFFVASYFSENSHIDKIKNKITSMCERVYREEYSNIIMFLVHLEKSHLILDELLLNAKKIFKDFEPIKLDKDVDFINSLVSKIPDEFLEFEQVEDARKAERKEEERTEVLVKEYENIELNKTDYDLDEDINTIDILSLMNRGVKTIEILGQVTKKHWGEIEKQQKYNLAEETYLIGLRTIGFYFSILRSNTPVLIQHIKEIIDSRHIKRKLDRAEIEEISAALLFKICSLAVYGISKRISNAIGIEELANTFEQIKEKQNFKSIELVNASIKLDHFKGFPEDELDKLANNSNSNYLVISVLQNFIINYLYLYHTEDDLKQRLCDKFKISLKTQRKIEMTSTVRKD